MFSILNVALGIAMLQQSSITAFTSWRTNLSPFTKGCREWDASMWLPQFLRSCKAPTIRVLWFTDAPKLFLQHQGIYLASYLANRCLWGSDHGSVCAHTFSAFWLWSSVVSVLVSVTTDTFPTGDLLVTSIFDWGSLLLSLLGELRMLHWHCTKLGAAYP